ncbi:ThuA domain-containing protein, partial [candidate division KSB1 bacterium]|nr:ThuA domain-containing protein [candidate division KSB1 bacterium]
MIKVFLALAVIFLVLGCAQKPVEKVLIIMDEKEQMQVLADYIENGSGLATTIVDQDSLPEDMASCRSVILYIHGKLYQTTEQAVIEYTNNGGRLIVLHHSISSGKAKNPFYFGFLGIRLDAPEKSRYPVLPGEGYGWVDPVLLTLVNLFPGHFVTTNKIDWPDTVTYTSSDAPAVDGTYAALKLDHSEAYMNHKFTDGRLKTVLCGMKFFDERNGQLFMQDRSVWYKECGNGRVFYFMAGHSEKDFENRNYSQMVLNA